MNPDQIDAVLAEFRGWLTQLAGEPGAQAATANERPVAEPPDLHTLLAQLTALRQEVNLQTRSSRTQIEQSAESLGQLTSALQSLQRCQDAETARHEAQSQEMIRPLLKAMVDVHDALALARREIQRVRDQVLPELDQWQQSAQQAGPNEPGSGVKQRPFWRRVIGGSSLPANAGASSVDRKSSSGDVLLQSVARIVPMLTSLVTGYTMSLQRIERTLQQFGLDAISAAGQPFDPDRMEVVEVMIEPGRKTTEVLEEVRRGYVWQGRLFRCAQVRVARGE